MSKTSRPSDARIRLERLFLFSVGSGLVIAFFLTLYLAACFVFGEFLTIPAEVWRGAILFAVVIGAAVVTGMRREDVESVLEERKKRYEKR